YECCLHGLVATDREPLLRTRLEALCGDTNATHKELYHEISCIPCIETPVGPLRKEDVMLRLRIERDPSDPLNDSLARSSVVLYGHPEPRSSRGATVRPAIYAQVDSDNAAQFASLLGYKFHSEYVRSGYWVLYRNTFKIIVSRILALPVKGDIQSAVPMDESRNWLVQIIADAVGQEQVPRMCEQLDEVKALL
ncbi:hypothetical protein DL89DRAFT_204480, partial [Linderina pennispora]